MSTIIEPRGTDLRSPEALESLIKLAASSAGSTARSARYLVDKIDQIRTADTWRSQLHGESKTWERFCVEILHYDAGYFEAISEGVAVLEGRGVKDATIGKPERVATRELMTAHDAGKKGGRGNKGLNNVQPFTSGGDKEYKVARLKRDAPDLYQQWQAGTISTHAAAIAAGIIKPTHTIPHDVSAAAKALRQHFSADELQALKDHL